MPRHISRQLLAQKLGEKSLQNKEEGMNRGSVEGLQHSKRSCNLVVTGVGFRDSSVFPPAETMPLLQYCRSEDLGVSEIRGTLFGVLMTRESYPLMEALLGSSNFRKPPCKHPSTERSQEWPLLDSWTAGVSPPHTRPPPLPNEARVGLRA